MNIERCECSCHREESHHISPCCYTCLRCEQDRIRPIDFGHGDLCRLCEAFAKLSDDELRRVSNGTLKLSARRDGLSRFLGAMQLGLEVDIEISRRDRERAREVMSAEKIERLTGERL